MGKNMDITIGFGVESQKHVQRKLKLPHCWALYMLCNRDPLLLPLLKGSREMATASFHMDSYEGFSKWVASGQCQGSFCGFSGGSRDNH